MRLFGDVAGSGFMWWLEIRYLPIFYLGVIALLVGCIWVIEMAVSLFTRILFRRSRQTIGEETQTTE